MLLKDELFNEGTLKLLSDKIVKVYPDFDEKDFIKESLLTFPELELKGRMSSVTLMLNKYLTNNYLEDLDILSKALEGTKEGQFIYGSVIEYVEVYGCKKEYLEESLDKIGEFTKYLSSEFAIRTFLNEYPEETIQFVNKWISDKDVHKRRLCSEGLRPSLPWAKKITMDYKLAAKPLNSLYYDSNRYVTRSVANHLNDISKIDPDFVLDALTRWKKERKQNDKELQYIINHSLRTLVKKGHPGTLNFLGYKTNPELELTNLSVGEQVEIGNVLPFHFGILSKENVKLIIDYTVLYLTKKGGYTSKTYKFKVVEMKKNEQLEFSGKRSFKEISTRSFNKGKHTLKIQINGVVYGEQDFDVK